MNVSSILISSEMSQARAPKEFYEWVMAKCAELGASDDAKAFARSGALLPKKFYDELFPLAIFANLEFAERADVRIQPNLGNDNFDATLTFSGADAPDVYVEITYSKDGYDESLRMEHLAEHGHVSFTGPVSVEGRRGAPNRNVGVELECAHHSTLVEQQLVLLEERIRGKSSKSYGPNHVLIVAVDDYFPLREKEDGQRVDDFMRTLLPTLALDFSRVVIVGVAGTIYLSCPLPVLN